VRCVSELREEAAELEVVEGFVDNIRYVLLTREGWISSLSNWKDEKSVVCWRTKMRHHEVQERGRGEVLSDYHLNWPDHARYPHFWGL